MDEPEDRGNSVWYPYDEGRSLGRKGPEGGMILRDEEFGDPEEPEDADARITLEQGGVEAAASFALTTALYGWMAHVRFFADEETVQQAYAEMKPELESLTTLIPYDDERDAEKKAQTLTEAIEQFVRRYP